MKNLAGAVLTISLMSSITLYGKKNKSLQVGSPNGVITVNIEAGMVNKTQRTASSRAFSHWTSTGKR